MIRCLIDCGRGTVSDISIGEIPEHSDREDAVAYVIWKAIKSLEGSLKCDSKFGLFEASAESMVGTIAALEAIDNAANESVANGTLQNIAMYAQEAIIEFTEWRE